MEITNWGSSGADLEHLKGIRDSINRNPDRRARIEWNDKGTAFRVVDCSRPIKDEYNRIVAWEPL